MIVYLLKSINERVQPVVDPAGRRNSKATANHVLHGQAQPRLPAGAGSSLSGFEAGVGKGRGAAGVRGTPASKGQSENKVTKGEGWLATKYRTAG